MSLYIRHREINICILLIIHVVGTSIVNEFCNKPTTDSIRGSIKYILKPKM